MSSAGPRPEPPVLRLAHAPAWIAASVLLVAGMLYVSLAPLNMPAGLPTNFDKLEHAAAYVLLAVWFTGLVPRSRYGRVALALALFGLAIELLQELTPFGRQGDPFDMAANLVGIGAGVAVAMRATGGWAARVESWLDRNRE
jgi:VanZ family protein